MFAEFYISKEKKCMTELCNFKDFKLQKHQLFIDKWFSQGNRKMLLFHGIGSGKTCTSIVAAKALKMKNTITNVYAVTPASLVDNFKKELNGKCGGFKSMPAHIHVFSYLKFINAVEKKEINIKNSLIIIDEIQNIVSESGSMYKRIFNILVTKQPVNLHVILLSGTPMFDQPHEIALTMNLLDLPKPLPGVVAKFKKKYMKKGQFINEKDFLERIFPYVSAFKGVGAAAYAKRTEIVHLCKMSEFQENSYAASMNGIKLTGADFSQAFLSGPRMASNLVYPNGRFGRKGKPMCYKQICPSFSVNSLSKYSTKFSKCIRNLLKSTGPTFAFSNFVEAGGVLDFVFALEANGFTQYEKKGDLSFGVFKSGDYEQNIKLLSVFNSKKNSDGSLIKVIIGSPAMKEGITLLRTREVHLLDLHWNNSRTEQIIGRAIRFCSHADLPENERHVSVHYYIATSKSVKSIDEHIMKLAQQKKEIISQFENALYRGAVDCGLFHNANGIAIKDCFDVHPDFVKKTEKRPTLTFLLNNKGVTTNSNKEKVLYKLLKSQGVNLRKKNPAVRLIANYKTNTSVKMSFRKYKRMGRLIGMESYKPRELNRNSVNVKIVPRKSIHKLNPNCEELQKIDLKGGEGRQAYNKQEASLKECPKGKAVIDGKCPSNYPFKKTKDNLTCCHQRPGKKSKGLVVAGRSAYYDGVAIKSKTKEYIKKISQNHGIPTNGTKLEILDRIYAI
jgi:hypothetical protein